jgi:hypothetical protein
MSNDYPRRVRDVLASQNKRSISIILTNTGPSSEASGGNHVVDIGADDYTEDTKTIAHTFAVATIDEAQNTYKPSNQYQQASLLNGNGYPAAISDEFEDDYYLGKETVGADGKAMFVNLSDSDLLNINIIKGKATATDDSSRNYIDLLAEVNRSNGEQSNSQLSINVERATLNVNSNASNSKFVVEGILEDESNIGKLTIQSLKGKYSKIPSYVNLENNATNPSQNGYTVKPNQLKNLGSQLPLLASGEIYVPNDVNDPEEFSKAQAGALIPGVARSGAARVSAKGMQPASALNRVTNGDFSRDTSVSVLDTDDTLSYGAYNNWIIPFEGRDEFIIPMLGIQIFALGAVCQLAAEATKLNLPGDARALYMQRFYVGFLTYFNMGGNNIDSTVITSLTFNKILAEAVARATAASLGLSGLGIAGFNNPWANNTGWYVINIRTLFRKISSDIMNVASIGSDISNLSQKKSGDTVSVVYNAENLITDNNITNIVNMFASRGASSSPYSNIVGNGLNIARNAGMIYNSNIDNSDPFTFAPALVPKADKLIKQINLNRDYHLGAGSKTQAIANASIRSRMILPRKLNTATTYASGDEGQINNLTGDVMSSYIASEENRLSIDDVKEMEKYLNSSYMPFYFHDLRTNEIIAFHAFLNNMSDNFSVDWQNTQAYGRVEPIYQYTGTTRELQIDFYVLATNELDHSRMWAKINKLVTLVYPQFTKGRALETTDSKKFIQPFSQIPGGSPMFRIRVGDVWKSNYNRFNAMRLFGLGQPEFNLTTPVNQSQTMIEERERLAREITDRIASGRLLVGDEIDIQYDSAAIASQLNGFEPGPLFKAVFGRNALLRDASYWFGWGQAIINNQIGILAPPTVLPNGEYTFRVEARDADNGARTTGVNLVSMTMLNPPASLTTPIASNSRSTRAQVDQLVLEAGGALIVLDSAAAGVNRERLLYGNTNIYMRVPTEELIRDVAASYSQDLDFDPAGLTDDPTEGAVESPYDSFIRGISSMPGRRPSGFREQATRQITVFNNILRRKPNPAWLAREVERQIPSSLRTELENQRNSIEQQQRLVSQFFNTSGDNFNPIMKSFEENGAGGGLAVVCKSMGFDWNESRWETNYTSANNNSRAPMWLKVTMGMTAIHDIVPGISSDGYMTAPVYPVGPIATVTDRLEGVSKATGDSLMEDIVASADASLLTETPRTSTR